MIKPTLAITSLFFLFAACADEKGKEVNIEHHRKHIVMLDSQYVHHIVSQQADSIASLYSTDGILMSPGEPTIKGSSNIKSWYTNAIEFGLRDIQFTPSELSGDDQHFIEIGQVKVGMKMGEADTLLYEHYKYLHVWTKTSNGEYKLSRDMWNADLIQIQGE